MARTPVGGPDRNAQKADFQYPAFVCIVRGPPGTHPRDTRRGWVINASALTGRSRIRACSRARVPRRVHSPVIAAVVGIVALASGGCSQ